MAESVSDWEPRSLAHSINAIARFDRRHADSLERSLDLAWERLDEDGGDAWYRQVLEMVYRAGAEAHARETIRP